MGWLLRFAFLSTTAIIENQLPTFPNEIFIQIIDILGADSASYTSAGDAYLRRTLCSLAITCRAFHGQCARHLFHTLWGEPSSPYAHYVERFSTLANILPEPEGPAGCVRTVTVTFFSGVEAALGGGRRGISEGDTATVEETFTTPWMTYFQETLPKLLHHLRNVHSFILDLEIANPKISFALLSRSARAAILGCLRSNPLESLV